MRNLDENGLIKEPTSKRYGLEPCKDTRREKFLLRFSWLWLLIPIMGIIGYNIAMDELTNEWGHYPWWL